MADAGNDHGRVAMSHDLNVRVVVFIIQYLISVYNICCCAKIQKAGEKTSFPSEEIVILINNFAFIEKFDYFAK